MIGTLDRETFVEMYKRGQGTYVRGTALVALGGLLLYAVYGLHDWMNFTEASGSWLKFLTQPLGVIPGTDTELTWRLLISVAFFLAGAFGLWKLHNWPTYAEYLIDTEGELRKVNWPARKEVQNSSLVVIVTVIILGLYIFGVDTVLTFVSRTLWRNL